MEMSQGRFTIFLFLGNVLKRRTDRQNKDVLPRKDTKKTIELQTDDARILYPKTSSITSISHIAMFHDLMSCGDQRGRGSCV